jgi:transcriptional regulator with XRE-family HTH domain
MADTATLPTVGALLRDWRNRRHLSQLGLALEAGVSARHLSFLETGRAQPSQEMLLRLAEQLEVPLRERNRMLLAAGYAPAFGERQLGEPELGPVREAIDQILRGHEPYPAVVVDRHWEMVAANAAVAPLIEGVAPHLLEPPVNVLRASLHPEGAAPRIVNLGQWRAHLLERLGRQAVATGDPALVALHEELSGYRAPPAPDHGPEPEIAVPLRIRSGDSVLSFISTIATFGTATEVTVSELAIESFFPADAETAAALQERAA